jgi:hypothetical protein
MNHSSIKQQLTYNSPSSIVAFNGDNNGPEFEKYQEDKIRSRYSEKQDNARTVMKGDFYRACDSNANESELTKIFFADENVKRIQKMLKREVYIKTNKKFKLDVEQDESDLLISMRAVFLEKARHLDTKIVHQVKELNKQVIKYIIPDMITEIKQGYGYQQEINQPLKLLARPLNMNSAGRKTLKSISTIYGF